MFAGKSWIVAAALFACGLPCATSLVAEEVVARDDEQEDLFDRPQPLDPQQARGEEGEDQLTASSWFLRGRLAYQREDLPQALRRYQRAFRYDADGLPILREIVPLAFELKHNAEAVRYAVLMAELSPKDAVLLRKLAEHLVEQEDYDRAISLYEKSLALTKVEKPGALEVLLSMEIGRLAFIEKRYELAADRFDVVRQALEDPKKYELSDKVHNALLGNPRVTYSLLAEAFLEAGRLEPASDMFEKALADKASQPLLAYHLARIEMANGRPQAAIEQLDKFLVPKQSVW